MSSPLSHEQIEELLGAYALDAVEPDEGDAIDVHLRSCPRCRAEVADHREVASLLAHGGVVAPEGLWDRIVATLDEAPPAGGAVPLPAPRTAPRVPRRLAVASLALAAAAAALVGVLGAKVADQNHRLDRVQRALQRNGVDAAALNAAADPRARTASLRSPSGRLVATAVVLPDGTGYLVDDRLRPLESGRTYQLWAQSGGRMISAGVLGPDPGVAAFHAPADLGALALTEEDGPGVVASRNAPLGVGPVTDA